MGDVAGEGDGGVDVDVEEWEMWEMWSEDGGRKGIKKCGFRTPGNKFFWGFQRKYAREEPNSNVRTRDGGNMQK
jgi:hypothetical protein